MAPSSECLAHRGVDILELEGLEQAQDLDVLPLAGLAHAGLEQATEGRELLGQHPALERSGLVEGAELLLEQRQVVQRVERYSFRRSLYGSTSTCIMRTISAVFFFAL